ncbi:MAG TPA: hypothetical protein VMT16_13185 [Thermoanaerobaculia bacterium]|nr:hypothetical protein [Thermoanaerobaculia bacterium]
MSQVAVEGTPARSVRRPVHLWVVGILALLWNSVGAFDYLATQLRLELYMSQFTDQQLAYFYGFPAWVVAAWAFGVWGAFAGSVGLLLARAWSVWMFAISIAGLAVSTIYNFGLSSGAEMMGATGVVMTAVIWLIALALLAYSVQQKNRGVLV